MLHDDDVIATPNLAARPRDRESSLVGVFPSDAIIKNWIFPDQGLHMIYMIHLFDQTGKHDVSPHPFRTIRTTPQMSPLRFETRDKVRARAGAPRYHFSEQTARFFVDKSLEKPHHRGRADRGRRDTSTPPLGSGLTTRGRTTSRGVYVPPKTIQTIVEARFSCFKLKSRRIVKDGIGRVPTHTAASGIYKQPPRPKTATTPNLRQPPRRDA